MATYDQGGALSIECLTKTFFSLQFFDMHALSDFGEMIMLR